jgi:hypothetical protein
MNSAFSEQVGKVFLALAKDLRLCLICERVFTRMEAAEHSSIPCKVGAVRAVRATRPHVTLVMSPGVKP